MRKLLLILPLLLSGCVNDTASYFINGADHALTVRAEQEWLWEDSVTLYVTATNQPACQRRITLGQFPLEEVHLELFQAGASEFVLKQGDASWTIDAAACTQRSAAQAQPGTPVGSFALADAKLTFLPAQPGTAPAAPPAALPAEPGE